MDTRSEHKKCVTCNGSFENRMELESHVKKVHGTQRKDDNENELISLMKNFISLQIEQRGNMDQVRTRPATTQITKARQPPV